MPLSEYIRQIDRALVNGSLQLEPCQRALQNLLKELGPATDFDGQRAASGGPSFILWHGQVATGCIFTIVGDLDKAYQTAQMQDWLRILPNVLLTNFVEFRQGESTARLGTWQANHIDWDHHSAPVENLLDQWATSHPPKITQADELATLAALFARQLRDAIQQSPDMREQINTSQMIFPQDFADDLAQTLIFNLIAARLRHSGAARSQAFTMRDAIWDQPPTNPVARHMLRHLEQLDSGIRWLLDLFVGRLEHSDIAALRRELGRRSRQDTPLSRLYVHFCDVYGITPPAEPSPAMALYITGSVHYLLQRRFKRVLGLADADVQIILPSAGDGTLAHFVLQQVYTTLRQQQQLGAWGRFVADDWLPRLVIHAPSLAAHGWLHLRLSLQLEATGYRFDSAQPLHIYLPASDQAAKIPWLFPGCKMPSRHLHCQHCRSTLSSQRRPICRRFWTSIGHLSGRVASSHCCCRLMF